MVTVPLSFQTTEEWTDSTLGLHRAGCAPGALPELDGGLEPIIFSGRDSKTGKSHTLEDRASQIAGRALKWAALRKKKNVDKKLAITVFSFPPDKGNVGTAAYLNVFGSIFRVLQGLKQEGYDVGDMPDNEDDLINSVLNDKEAKFASPDLNIEHKMSVKEYEKLCLYQEDLRGELGTPARQPQLGRPEPARVRQEVRQRLHRRPAHLRLRGRPDAPALLQVRVAPPRLRRVLHVHRARVRRRRRAALRHARLPRVHARQAGWHVRRPATRTTSSATPPTSTTTPRTTRRRRPSPSAARTRTTISYLTPPPRTRVCTRA